MRNDETLDQLLNLALPRLEELWQRADTVPEEREALIWESLDQLSSAFEKLHIAMEELQLRSEELEALNQSLAAECRRYRDLFECAPGAYLITDLKAVIQQANQTAARLLNASAPSYLVGKPLCVFVAEKARSDFYTQLDHLQTGKEVKGWEVLLQPRWAEPFSAICTVGTVQDSRGKASGLHWLLQETIKCKQAEACF